MFNYALDDLAKVHTRLGVSARGDAAREDRLLLARRFREAIFKSGITAGYARVRLILWSLVITANIFGVEHKRVGGSVRSNARGAARNWHVKVR